MMKQRLPAARRQRSLARTGLIYLLIILLSLLSPFASASAQSEESGYRSNFQYPSGLGGNQQPTGEKPESKLWWNDGDWYASLWKNGASAYHIFRLDLSTQTWVDTGTAIDNRRTTRADALWDGNKLYIASHVFSTTGQATTSAYRARLYRYSYNSANKTYTPDAGFPVEITGGKSETLVLDKDSAGQLWVTYVQNNRVMVNHSINGDDRQWGTPFVLPAGGAENVASDDISSIITYNQHVGVMWSNQNSPKTMYFAVHPVGAPDNVWTRVRAYGLSADDHISLKSLETDNAGNVYAAVKTSRNDQLIMLLVCKNNINRCKTEDDWLSYPVYTSAATDPTRPILLIDNHNRHLYVFARNTDDSGNDGIYYKRASLDAIQFPSGIGTPFIKNSLDVVVNNPTSTKQNLNASTGLLVLASDNRSRYYLHNYLALNGSPPPTTPPPTTTTPPPTTTTPPPTTTTPPPTTTTPPPITTTPPTVQPTYSLAVANNGAGTVTLNPAGGSYAAGTVVTLAAAPAAGWVFAGWGGDLSGTSNPASLTMDANKSVTATFSAQSGGGGTVSHVETVLGSTLSAATVSTAGSLNAAAGDLYLAAVASRNMSSVSSVSGLGLAWTPVLRQCAGRSQTMIDVWMAQGTPTASEPVTATFPSTVKSAVIAVSHYSGVSATSPLSGMLGGNSLGVNGACLGGTDSASYSFTTSTTTTGGMLYTAASMRNRTHTPGSGYTERGEGFAGSSGDVASVAIQDRPVTAPAGATINGSFSGSVDWAITGLEIRPGP